MVRQKKSREEIIMAEDGKRWERWADGLSRSATFYEWTKESVTSSPEHHSPSSGDIEEVNFAPTLAEFKNADCEKRISFEGEEHNHPIDTHFEWERIGLVRRHYSGHGAWGPDTHWAYIKDGKLAEEFEDSGIKVPKKYLAEFNRHKDWASKLGIDRFDPVKVKDYFKVRSSNGQFIVNSKTGVILDSQWDLDEPHNITKFDMSSLNSACISWSDKQKTIELDSVDILCIGYYHQVPTALSNYEPKVEDPDLCQH